MTSLENLDLGELPLESSPMEANNSNGYAANENPSSGDGSPNSSPTSDAFDMPPEMWAALGVQLIDIHVGRAYGKPLNDVERAALSEPFKVLAKKYLGGAVSAEWAAVGAIGMVYIPRYLAGPPPERSEENDSVGTGPERERQKPSAPYAGGASLDALEAMFGGGARST